MSIPILRDRVGFQSIPIKECGESLVNVEGKHHKIHVHPYYFSQAMPTALDSVYVRETVLSKLIAVAESLPSHIHLLLWDGWRPLTVQQALYDDYVQKLTYEYPKLSLERLQHMALDFVSRPSKEPTAPSTHATGGSIDLTLCNASGYPLNLGTAFDDFSERANTRFLEEKYAKTSMSHTELQALKFRRLLFDAMTSEGFTSFLNEWWHYDFGNQWWAKIRGEDSAFYGYTEMYS